MIRYITDDLEISSDDSVGGKVKTKYTIRYFLPRMCTTYRPQKSIHKSLASFLVKHTFCSVLSENKY